MWDQVLSREQILASVAAVEASPAPVLEYLVDNGVGGAAADGVLANSGTTAAAGFGRKRNDLFLGSKSPYWEYSTAPLETRDGRAVDLPQPGSAGHAVKIHDQQVGVGGTRGVGRKSGRTDGEHPHTPPQTLMVENFANFPETAITVDFWMWSVDGCRQGVPFSYATGDYKEADNSFLIFNYNNWGVSVMEDEGTVADHTSGIGATDGEWHYIAVTWESRTGTTILYDNTRPVWIVNRGKGKRIPSGGTLVVGREQDCKGGCFDSGKGASGNVQPGSKVEYGAQDFFGVIEEMRVWNRVLTQEELMYNMVKDDGALKNFENPGQDPGDANLVAYWKFDQEDGGSTYRIPDKTGNGHDLKASNPISYEVVQWLTHCGDGIVEGDEQCDTGDTASGDGCDDECRVEPGWTCTTDAEGRSTCDVNSGATTRTSEDEAHPDVAPVDPSQWPDSPGADSGGKFPDPNQPGGGAPSSSSSSPAGDKYPPAAPAAPAAAKKKHNAAGTAFGVLFCIALVGAVGVGYLKREELYDRFPQVKRGLDSLADKIRPRQRPYHMLDLDLDDDFLGMHPPRQVGQYQPPQPTPPDAPAPSGDDDDEVPKA